MKLLELIQNIQNKIDDNFYEKNKIQILDEINKIIDDDNYQPLLKAIDEGNFYSTLSYLQYIFVNEKITEPFFIERDVDFKVFGRILPRIRL